jgi:hypothetical protein
MNALRSAEFLAAVLDVTGQLPAHVAVDANTAARFAVHRHTCRHGLIETLRTAYPAVATAVGETYFDALAVEFIQHAPPASPVLHEYSPDFPDFLDQFPPLADWPWLGDVARVDWARREAYHAADAESLSSEQLQAWPLEALLHASLHLHPSLRTLSSAYPAWSLWHCQQSPGDGLAEDRWSAESLQVWRIDGDVHLRLLDAGEAALRRGLTDGLTLADALQAALTLDPEFDASRALAALIGDRLIVAVIPKTQ